MSRLSGNLLDLDVEKLFEERSIPYIIEIERLLDGEIERKRNELRSMVGDRYKDVLAASDAITFMKETSNQIVDSIERITETCEKLIENPVRNETNLHFETNRKLIENEERTLIIQIRLAMFLNEQIWIALDEENNLNAAQYYLLALHIHTGLSLSKKEHLDRVPFLQHVRDNLTILRGRIFDKITEKLESVEITAEETSQNLNALLLLENQSVNSLLDIFIEHRKTALNTVINMPYSSVRIQVSSMVKCLITTIRLLHRCFISVDNSKKGLIWSQIEEICSESSPSTLSKLSLPVTPLVCYIPEIVKQYRPKCEINTSEHLSNAKIIMQNWLDSTKQTLTEGLKKFLQLITNVKGLHLTREESLKIKPPDDWNQICKELFLPDNFEVWHHFFQPQFTVRCKEIIKKKIETNLKDIKNLITNLLKNNSSSEFEFNMKNLTWREDSNDVSKNINNHKGLTMKTRGYSKVIVDLCEKLDEKFFELIQDVTLYLYGDDHVKFHDFKLKKKFVDRNEIERHLRHETVESSINIPCFAKSHVDELEKTESFVVKSVISARFLIALIELCPNFKKCCTFDGSNDDWSKISDFFDKMSQSLWRNWVWNVSAKVAEKCCQLSNVSTCDFIKITMRWDKIEIQEQTEEKTFTSQIRVPLKPSRPLIETLALINDELNNVIPHTLIKTTHQHVIEECCEKILQTYSKLVSVDLNQKQSLQFLFDVKFLTTLCIARDNSHLYNASVDVCDKLREKIDPFDLDVFYSFLQSNVKRAVLQSQAILGCLIPSNSQLDSLGVSDKKEPESTPSVLALSVPTTNSWLPQLPILAPYQKVPGAAPKKPQKVKKEKEKSVRKVVQESGSVVRQSAASLFGGLATDWFS